MLATYQAIMVVVLSMLTIFYLVGQLHLVKVRAGYASVFGFARWVRGAIWLMRISICRQANGINDQPITRDLEVCYIFSLKTSKIKN